MDMYDDIGVKKYVDVDAGLGRVRGNKKLFERMLSLFLQSGELASLENAIAENRIGDAANIAHAIKGMTGNLALTPLFEISSQLMNELRAGAYSDTTYAEYKLVYAATREQVDRLVN